MLVRQSSCDNCCIELHCCFDIVALVRVKTQKVAARAWRKELTMTRSTTFKSFPLNEPLSDVPNALTHWRFCFQGRQPFFSDLLITIYQSTTTCSPCSSVGRKSPTKSSSFGLWPLPTYPQHFLRIVQVCFKFQLYLDIFSQLVPPRYHWVDQNSASSS